MNGIATGGMEWILQIVLIALLAGTLFHAIRLERALGVLKRDRAALEALVSEFNASSQAAEQGVERLREAAEGAGRQLVRQMESGGRLKDDLVFLNDRGEKLGDRLDRLVRAARVLDQSAADPAPDSPSREPLRREPPPREPPPREPQPREPQPRELLPRDAVAWARPREPEPVAEPRLADLGEMAPRVRSQAERDLLRALRLSK